MNAEAAAELLDDRGAAVAGPEFFRSPEFLAAEGVTHTLRVAALRAPLVVREVPGGEGLLDATSPYGYPGFEGPATARVDSESVDFRPSGLVSVFVRHRLGEPPLGGARERGLVQVADPELPRKSRPSDRQQIRRNLRRGYAVKVTPGPQAAAAEQQEFVEVYEQTMRRTEAAPRYFFDREYFERILGSSRTWLCLARRPDDRLAAGSLAAASDGFLHYYLSGTADAALRDSPMKNVVSALIELAIELGMPLNLGGGLSPGDALEEFKRGFANRTEPWYTSEIVCDRAAYERLSGRRDPRGFFPAYRAP